MSTREASVQLCPCGIIQRNGQVGDCVVIDFDSAHMCMISKPGELAAITGEA